MPDMQSNENAFDFTFKTIDGKPMPLEQYRGKVLLIVNTASECGFTPQYAGLEELSQRYREQGLVVVGVPSNDFGAQEPGSNSEIAEFCLKKYQTTFPLTQKEAVIGVAAHPFYRWIATRLGEKHLPAWNFTKYLMGRDGVMRGMFPSKVKPDSPDLIKAIETELTRSERATRQSRNR